MSCLGHKLLRKHFHHHGESIARLHQVCHSSSSRLAMSDDLYFELCHEIISRGGAEHFWSKFLSALGGNHVDDWNYPVAEAYIVEFFPKVRKVRQEQQSLMFRISILLSPVVRRVRSLLS